MLNSDMPYFRKPPPTIRIRMGSEIIYESIFIKSDIKELLLGIGLTAWDLWYVMVRSSHNSVM